MGIESLIAQFGQNTGSGISAGINRGIERRDRNRLAELARQERQNVRDAKAAQEREKAEEAYYKERAAAIYSLPPEQRAAAYQGMRQGAEQRGYDLEGAPETWSEDYMPVMMGLAGVGARGNTDEIASIQDRNALFAIVEDESAPEWKRNAARIELGLDPRATGSSAITIAQTPGLTTTVAESEGTIAGAKTGASEEAKLIKQSEYQPAIAASVKEAQDRAAAAGETFTDLNRAKAAMPGLRETIADLKELAPLVTHTFGGKAFDAIVKQTGFGTTEGANARAKYTAIIDNQVLPLLKQTFGSAFTEAEGERLRATMGDPDAGPEQKAAQLDAFIEQKYRDIEAKERELAAYQPQNPATQTPAQPAAPASGGFRIISVEQ